MILTDKAEDMETGERILLSQEEELAQRILVSVSKQVMSLLDYQDESLAEREVEKAFRLSFMFFNRVQKRRMKLVKKIQNR